MYIDTPAVRLESGLVGETNVAMSIGVPDAFDPCIVQSDGILYSYYISCILICRRQEWCQ